MVLVSMAGEHSGFPGSALNSLLLFPCFLTETVVFPFILNGKGHARFKKKRHKNLVFCSHFKKPRIQAKKTRILSVTRCSKARGGNDVNITILAPTHTHTQKYRLG